MNKLRVSAIRFLNTAPLMWDFERGEKREQLARQFHVHYTLPSACARELSDQAADIGILPIAAYATIPDLRIVPNVAIAAKNAVRSILLVGKTSIDKARTVAVDSSSRTSVVLARVLYEKLYGARPRFQEMLPAVHSMLRQCDAALLIGDTALKIDRSKYVTRDLAADWRELTGRPMVFAFWAVRKRAAGDSEMTRVSKIFQQSRDHGLQNIQEIAHLWTKKLQISQQAIVEYLTHNIDYGLDEENIEGMQLFFRFAEQCGALPLAPDLQFIGAHRDRVAI